VPHGEPSLLVLPARHAARLVALRLLDDAAGAAGRMVPGGDPEALHDFRVALRRLRSLTRAYGDALAEAIPDRQARRLRDVARATGASRDVEVHLAWLASERDALPPDRRAGADWLMARLERQRRKAEPKLRRAAHHDFPRLRAKLAPRLGAYATTVRLDGVDTEPGFAEVTAQLVLEHAETLARHLARVRSAADEAAAHDARIVGKRLRYLLEPLAEELDGVKSALKPLRALQDALGDLHDTHVFRQEIDAAAEEAQAEDAGGGDGGARGAGLAALAGALRARETAAFAEVEHAWLGGAAAPFLESVAELAHAVAARGRGDVEIERKFLLRALPDGVRDAPAREIEQGYLPGERLVERLRRVRDGERVRYYRTVKLGDGLARTEVEEETTPELFASLWPLTEGRRVVKRRYRVRAGVLRWEVDEFLDRDLVLAEVELPSERTPAEPPEWLRPSVVREVTGEPEFTNARLAR
jgi:CHAD domain-containing protein/CYTH domain-containing protein